METVPIQGIEEIVIEVSDLDRAVAFYRDVVGLPLFSRGPDEAWFRAGEQWLAVFLKGREGAIGPHFAFRVAEADVARAEQAMQAYGMQVQSGEYSGGQSVYICDPDGNRIELHGKRREA